MFITGGELKYKKYLLQNMLAIYLFFTEHLPVWCFVLLQVHCVRWMLMNVQELTRRVKMGELASTAMVVTGVFV